MDRIHCNDSQKVGTYLSSREDMGGCRGDRSIGETAITICAIILNYVEEADDF